MAFKLEPERASRGGVDGSQAVSPAAPNGETIGHATFDRDGVADPPRHAHFHRIVETAGDRRVLLESPVAQYPDDVSIDLQRTGLFDDKGAHQTAPDLLAAVVVRVIPVGAGVRGREFVGEARFRLNRWLGDIRRAIHRAGDAHPVPMDRGVLGKPVLDNDTNTVALPQADFRTSDAAAVTPHNGLW